MKYARGTLRRLKLRSKSHKSQKVNNKKPEGKDKREQQEPNNRKQEKAEKGKKGTGRREEKKRKSKGKTGPTRQDKRTNAEGMSSFIFFALPRDVKSCPGLLP